MIARWPNPRQHRDVQVIKDSHGKTSQLSAADIDALIAYVTSIQ